jgi:hypothetical protein
VNPTLQLNEDSLEVVNKILGNTHFAIINNKHFPNISNVVDELFLNNHCEMKKEILEYIERVLYKNERVNIVFDKIKFNEDKNVSLLIATIIEYLAVDILEISGIITRENLKVRITNEYLNKALERDEGLKMFLKNNKLFDFKDSGNLHRFRVSKSKRKTKKSKKKSIRKINL